MFRRYTLIRNQYDPTTDRTLFDEMSATYGLMNLISSFGFTVSWRHQAVKNLPLDGAVHVSAEMVRRARQDWPFRVETHLVDIFSWDFVPSSADVVMSSFGLKTFDRIQQKELSRRVAQLLRP